MGKKTKKAQVESKVLDNTNQTEEENQMEATPATMVESNEAQLFAGQTEDRAGSTDGESQAVDTLGTVKGADSTQAQPAEKPAPKPRVNRRPYIELVSEHLEVGDLERKEIIKLVLDKFQEIRKGGIETFVTDLLNPKYSYYKERAVTKLPDGKLIFADKVAVPTEGTPAEPSSTDAISDEAHSKEAKE